MNSVIIDTDPTWGRPQCDIDDVLAVAFAAAAGIPLTGLCSVHGNAPLHHTHRTAQWLADRYGITAFRGARDVHDVHTPAVQALVEHTGVVVALGPLTNVAAALRRGARWERLVVLGGTLRRRPNLRPLHTTEFNLAVDPRAAEVVLSAATDVVLMKPCRQVRFGLADLRGLPAPLRRGVIPWWLSSPLRHGRFGFHPWDVLAVALLVAPDLFRHQQAEVRLTGRWGFAGQVQLTSGSARVITDVDARGFHELWEHVIRSPHRPV